MVFVLAKCIAISLLYLLPILQFRTVLLHCEDVWGCFPQRLSPEINIAQKEPLEHHTTGTLSVAALQRRWAVITYTRPARGSPAWGNAAGELPLSFTEGTTETDMCKS